MFLIVREIEKLAGVETADELVTAHADELARQFIKLTPGLLGG